MACLWKAGYAVTDPGYSFYHPELRMFDPVSQEGRQLLYAFTEGLSGACDGSCQVCISVFVDLFAPVRGGVSTPCNVVCGLCTSRGCVCKCPELVVHDLMALTVQAQLGSLCYQQNGRIFVGRCYSQAIDIE